MASKTFPTIGILSEFLPGDYLSLLYKGLIRSCHKKKYNLTIFLGGALNTPLAMGKNSNIIYQYAGRPHLDALIILSNNLGTYSSFNQLRSFIEHYSNLPLLSVGVAVEGIHSLLVENKAAIKEMVNHLVREHHYKKIAFISGPVNHPEAVERLAGYKEGLAANGLPYDPRLVEMGGFTVGSGFKAAETFYKERKVSIEAVVCANDNMALGFYHYCKKNGIDIPGDVAVTGYDNLLDSSYTAPPLTTVGQPFYGCGMELVNIAERLIAGQEVPQLTILPSTLILRESCGCKIIKDSISPDPPQVLSIKDRRVFMELMKIKSRISHSIIRSGLLEQSPNLNVCIEKTLDALFYGKNDKLFLIKTARFIKTKRLSEQDLNTWQDYLNWLFVMIRKEKGLTPVRYRAKYLIFHLLHILNKEKQNKEGDFKVRGQHDKTLIDYTVNRISSSIMLPELLQTVKQELSRYDLSCYYLMLYEGDQLGYKEHEIDHKQVKVVLGFDGKNVFEGACEQNVFDPLQIIPPHMYPLKEPNVLMIQPLYMNEYYFGYIILNFKFNNISVYIPLQQQISTNLNIIRLFSESQKRQQALNELNISLEQKVSERTEELVKQQDFVMKSIGYARSIQDSILPDDEVLQRNLGSYFIFWKPRDIVGGDIYWFKETPGGFLLALADCTGHGIPAAFTTMTCNSVLNRITEHICDNDPALILNELNRIVKKTLHQDSDDLTARNTTTDEGMDVCLCYYHKQHKQLYFAGANRPLLYVRKGKLEMIPGDRQSIGYRSSDIFFTYTNHCLDVQKDDMFYLTSDGYTDQLGGKKGFTFGKKRFTELLEQISRKNLHLQKQLLIENLEIYQGNEKQIDDITILGFKGTITGE